MGGSFRPKGDERFIQIETEAVRRLADVGSRHHDLLFASECAKRLLALMAQDSRDHVLVQALWASTVVAYARSFTSGRVRALDKAAVESLISQGEEVHGQLMTWRDKHIAHQVDRTKETVVIAIALRGSSIVGIGLDNGKELTPSMHNVEVTITHIGRVVGRLAKLVDGLQLEVRAQATKQMLAGGKDVSAAFLGEDYGTEVSSPMGGYYRTWTPAERKSKS